MAWDKVRSICGRVWLFDVDINPPYLEAGLCVWEPTEGDRVSFEIDGKTIAIHVPKPFLDLHNTATIAFPDEPVEFVVDSLTSSSSKSN